MEGNKILKLVAVILAVLTVVFFILYVGEKKKTEFLSDDFAKEAVENIRSRGVKIDENVIVKKIPNDDVYFFSLEGDEAFAEKVTAAVRKILGDDVAPTKLNTPSGISVAFYDEDNPDTELGKLHVSQSDFSFVYSAYGSGISTATSAIYNDETDISEPYKKIIDDVVGCLNESKKMSGVITGSTYNDEYEIVSVTQYFNGFEVDGAYINFVFENEKLVHALGSWIVSLPKAKYHEETTDGINVIYKLELDDISEILEEKRAYSLKTGENGNYYLFPCWKITVKDKKGKLVSHCIDAL